MHYIAHQGGLHLPTIHSCKPICLEHPITCILHMIAEALFLSAEMKKNAVNLGATPTVYVSVKDVDGLHQRAKAAGATFVKNPFDTEWGSRDFHMKDPEGRVWFFGTFSTC